MFHGSVPRRGRVPSSLIGPGAADRGGCRVRVGIGLVDTRWMSFLGRVYNGERDGRAAMPGDHDYPSGTGFPDESSEA